MRNPRCWCARDTVKDRSTLLDTGVAKLLLAHYRASQVASAARQGWQQGGVQYHEAKSWERVEVPLPPGNAAYLQLHPHRADITRGGPLFPFAHPLPGDQHSRDLFVCRLGTGSDRDAKPGRYGTVYTWQGVVDRSRNVQDVLSPLVTYALHLRQNSRVPHHWGP